MYYEPAEDSQLMVEILQKCDFAPLSVLDIGTGSGILGKVALEKWPNATVLGIDINDEALKEASQYIPTRKSDLFSEVAEKFDLLICNPPYLPANKLDPNDILTKALVGGKKGYEYIAHLLSKAFSHMNPNGKFLLLFSNLTNKDVVDKLIEENMFVSKELISKNVGMMETLYIYELTRLPIVDELSEMTFTLLTHGKRGSILRSGDVVIKTPKSTSDAPGTVLKEVHYLKKVNELGIGPKFIKELRNGVMMGYIEGTLLRHWKGSKEEWIVIARSILEQCHRLDLAGIQKDEMTNPYKHIIIQDTEATFIDFERCTLPSFPSNVTQFCEFLQNKNSPYPMKRISKEVLQEYKQNKDLELVLAQLTV